MPLQLTAIVVGAGIGGLAAAVALRRAGHKVTIVERYESKREVGFAVTLTPNATRVLQSLGLNFETARAVHCTEEVIIQATPTQWLPDVLYRSSLVDLEKHYGAPWMSVHRVDLHDCLRDLATSSEGEGVPAVMIEGVRAAAFRTEGSIALQTGEVLTADLVVAADGVRSTAHKHIMEDGQEKPATLTGVSNVRFCLASKTITEDDELNRYLELAPNGASVSLGTEPDHLILRYPCRDNLLHNIGLYASVEDVSAQEEKWKGQTTKQVAFDRIQGFHPCLHRLLEYCSEEELYLWKVADRDPLPSYHKDRLIVLGDAAHPMLPTLGNGAGMAIEDAAALGVALKGLKAVSEVLARLKTWDSVRRPRASAAVLLSRTMSVDYKLSRETQELVRAYLSEQKLPEFKRPCVNKWLFSHDCIEETRRAITASMQGD